jgi:hypothetical protein
MLALTWAAIVLRNPRPCSATPSRNSPAGPASTATRWPSAAREPPCKPPSNEPANSASRERTGRHRDRYRRGSADTALSRSSACPRGQGPLPAAGGPVPGPGRGRVTAGTAGDTHSSVPEGLAPSRVSRRATRSGDGALLSSRAIPALSLRRLGCTKPALAAGPADSVAQVDERSVICTPGQGQLPRQEPAGQQWRATAQRGWRDTDDHLI